MTFSERRRFYSGKEWRLASLKCREAANWLCEICTAEGRTGAAELAHHRVPVTEGGSKLDPKNLAGICRQHHEQLHGRANEQKWAWCRYLQELMDGI